MLNLNFIFLKIFDLSGNGNHAIKNVDRGPSWAGEGYSAFIRANNYIEIKDNEVFNSPLYSITMWVYIIKSYEG